MSRKFQYLIYGSGLTLLVLVAIFSFVLSKAQANELTPQNGYEQITNHNHLEITPIQTVEEDPIPNTSNNHQEQSVPELDESHLPPPVIAISEDDVKQEDVGETVLTQVANFNKQRMASLLANGGGWLYIQSDHYAPDSSNALLPNGADLPVSYQTESWFHLYPDGWADQSHDRMVDSNGTLVQEGFFKDGWIYDDKYEQAFQSETNTLVVNPDQDGYGFLSRGFESGAQLTGWKENQDNRAVYIASSTANFENPVQFGVAVSKVVSMRFNFIYDLTDGTFLYGETIYVLESGEQILTETVTQTKFEIVSESDLPESLNRFLAEN